jgi:prefoldin subunit 5
MATSTTPTINDVFQQLQLLVSSVSGITAKIDAIEKKLASVEATTERVVSLEREVSDMKVTINNVDQDARACLVRITGLAVSEAEMNQHGFEKAIIKKVYDRIVKPILGAAKNWSYRVCPHNAQRHRAGVLRKQGRQGQERQGAPPHHWCPFHQPIFAEHCYAAQEGAHAITD